MSRQRDPPAEPGVIRKTPITDSPWFWVAVFCAAGMMFLLVIWPRYAARQRRLEMQYLARQEIARRHAEGDSAARPPGQEGDAPPPAVGELIIPLWPLMVPLTALLVISAVILWRGRRRANRADPSGRGKPA
jgi:hypothetical protein